MMKPWIFLRTVLVAAAVLCFWPGNSQAQYMKREVAFSVSGGFMYPTGKFGEVVEHGNGFSGSFGYFASPSWQLTLSGAFHRYDTKPLAKAQSGISGVRYVSVAATANLYLYPESWFTPYAGGGAGIYRGTKWYTSAGGAESTITRTRLGLVGGFGLSAHKEGSRFSAFTEVMYHHILTDGGASDQTVVWQTGLRISFGGRPF